MADKQSPISHGRPHFTSSQSQGISLAELAGPLNFGPSLVPTSGIIGTPNTPVSSVDTPSSSNASASTTAGGENQIGTESEKASFIGQQTSSLRSQPPLFTGFQQLPSQQGDEPFLQGTASTPQIPLGQQVTLPPQRSPLGQQMAPPTQRSPLSVSGAAQPMLSQNVATPSQKPLQSVSPLPPQIAEDYSQSPQPEGLKSESHQTYSTPAKQTPVAAQVPPMSEMTSELGPSQYAVPPPTPVIPTRLPDPVTPHWFYLKEGRKWTPFSRIDSESLELASKAPSTGKDRIVPTDGGRYDVNLDKRLRHAIYWDENVSVVRRCSWFCKGSGESKLTPYTEDLAVRLEAEYMKAIQDNQWPRKVELSDNESIMMHNTNVMVHFGPMMDADTWTGEDNVTRPRVVRRGVVDIEDEIEDGEPAQVDHLVFVVHGIGPIADLRFRNIIECVDDFRMVSLLMLRDHYDELAGGRTIGRVEFLPVQWHSRLHDDSTGLDRRLQSISLSSIRGLREFTNSTLLDVLFFTSPTYCQTILEAVKSEITRMLEIFRKRNPVFQGKISVCGHSLGSSILFDLLFHQKSTRRQEQKLQTVTTESKSDVATILDTSGLDDCEDDDDDDDEEDETGKQPSIAELLAQIGLQDFLTTFESERITIETLMLCHDSDFKEMGVPLGPRKKLMGYIRDYEKNEEKRKHEREEKARKRAEAKAKLKAKRKEEETVKSLPEPTITESVASVEVIYHQGLAGTGQPYVEYPQLGFEPFALFALGSPIGMFLTVRGVDQIGTDFQLPTCRKFFNIFHPAYRIEPLVDPSIHLEPVLMPHHKGRKRMHLELREKLSELGANLKQNLVESMRTTWNTLHDFARAHTVMGTPESHDEKDSMTEDAEPEVAQEPSIDIVPEVKQENVKIGRLNCDGKRIDYVLQEKPIESLNEYLFALSSHLCYWLSEDTALFMLKEIYSTDGL